MSNWHGGKGSATRPLTDKKKFDENWDKIFGKSRDEKTKLSISFYF
jgi:hypothetical protein